MGYLKITKNEMAKIFTKELIELEGKFSDPNSIEYSVSYGQMIKTLSLADLLAGNRPEPGPKTFDPNDYAFDRVQARSGKKRASSKKNLNEEQIAFLLAKIQQELSEREDADRKEQSRIAALSPEQKQKEINDLLGELRKDSGFMEISIKPTNKKRKK